MRFHTLMGLSALGILVGVVPEVRAQQGYFNRVSNQSRTTVNAPAPERDDLFAPYHGSSAGHSANGQYRRAASEVPPPRRESRPSAAVSRNYFPDMRTGYGPNQNYVNPARLCVPGRRAMIYGR